MPRIPKDHLFQASGGTTATFIVEIGGQPVGRFSECQGLEVEIEVEEHQEGGVNGYVHKLPGRMSWQNLVLKRGVTWDNLLLDWFHRSSGDSFVAEGKVERETVGVTLVSGTGERLRTWTLFEALPVKWSGPSFSNTSDELPTEELELAHHGFACETHQ